jgi:VCBS repeat-containing protein
VDNPANTFTAVSTATSSTNGYGTYTMTAGGVWTYTLNNSNAAVQALNVGNTLTDTFTVTSADGTSRVVTVTINGANDAPTVAPVKQTGTEDTPLTLTWTAFGGADVDNTLASLSVKIISLPTDGTLTLNGSAVSINQVISKAAIDAGQLVFTPSANASSSASGTAGYGNNHQDYAHFNYQVTDGSTTSATGDLVIDITPVADLPNFSLVSQVNYINSSPIAGDSALTTAGITQANLETILGLPSGKLDTFDPPTGVTSDAGTVSVFDGGYTQQNLDLKTGQQVSFNWSFFNGEDSNSEISQGYNDQLILVVTDSSGTKTYIQLASSEQVGANTNGAAADATGVYSFTATTTGNYQFSWLVLNGIDGNKDSTISVSAPIFVIGGTNYGEPIDIPIATGLTDIDGSESLAFTITGVPTTAIFSAGTNLGGGIWSFTEAQLDGLQLYPASGFTGAISLSVTATSTELATGATATTAAQSLTINISAPTNTVEGTNSNETLSGGTGDDLIQGFGGNDTLNGNNGSDLLYGGVGNDTLNGGAGNDTLNGGVGTDTLVGGTGSDVLIGGAGNDTMTGGNSGSDDFTTDTFVWELSDQGTLATPAVDTINNFGTAAASAGGDVLDLKDLLVGESYNSGSLDAYLHFEYSGGNTTIFVSSTGAFTHGNAIDTGTPPVNVSSNDVQQIVLAGVNLTAGFATDAEVINNLIAQQKLITD